MSQHGLEDSVDKQVEFEGVVALPPSVGQLHVPLKLDVEPSVRIDYLQGFLQSGERLQIAIKLIDESMFSFQYYRLGIPDGPPGQKTP